MREHWLSHGQNWPAGGQRSRVPGQLSAWQLSAWTALNLSLATSAGSGGAWTALTLSPANPTSIGGPRTALCLLLGI